MAGSSRIKGITIELDGETTGLQKALSNVTKESIDIQKELKDVERLLKFDPGNTEVLAQKQSLLAKQLENTTNKLNQLKSAQEQVDAQFAKGDIGEQQYRAFQREIQYTEADLKKLKQSLSKIDDGANVDKLKKDMKELGESTEEAEDKVGELRSGLSQLVVGAAAGVGISNVIEDAFDTSNLDTKLSISMELDPQSIGVVKEAINNVTSYGVDAEAALEGVRRQWALNKDASNESNAAVVKGASAIVASYGDVDFTELIQETNELANNLGITDEQALGLTYSLLKLGFPPDQLDIITEYGSQLARAGYSAEEIQGIMAAGVKTGTWNIDVLLDGLKEGRIVLAEFGQGVDQTTSDMFNKIGVSGEQLQSWGKAVASGGEKGKEAMQEVAQALSNVKDKTLQNQLGTKVFGTLWEENGIKITDTILGMSDNLMTAKENQNNLNGAISDLDNSPMIEFQKALADLKLALAPLLSIIANVIGSIASFISKHSQISAVIAAVTVAVSIMIGVLTGIVPLITSLIGLAGAMSVSIGAISLPILAVVAAIAALVAGGVLLYSNWDLIKVKASEVWEAIKTGVSTFAQTIVNFFTVTIPESLNSLGEFFGGLWETIKVAFTEGWNSIVVFFTESVPAWLESIGTWFAELPNKIAYGLGYAIASIIQWGMDTWSYLQSNVPLWIEGITNFFAELPGKIWTWLVNVVAKLKEWSSNIVRWISTNVSAWITNIVTFFSQLPGKIWTWLVNCVTNITTWGANMLTEAKSGMQSVFNGIVDTFTNLPSKMAEIGTNIVQGIKDGISSAWEGMTGWIGGLCDSFTQGIKDALDIHSPSRVMFGLGEYTGEGFALGIQSTIGAIARQSDAMANAVKPNVGIDKIGVTNSSINGSTGAVTNQQTIIVPVTLDGQVIAKAIAPYSDRIQGNNLRLAGRGVGL